MIVFLLFLIVMLLLPRGFWKFVGAVMLVGIIASLLHV